MKLPTFDWVGFGTGAQVITTAAVCADANGAALKIANAIRTLTNHLKLFMIAFLFCMVPLYAATFGVNLKADHLLEPLAMHGDLLSRD